MIGKVPTMINLIKRRVNLISVICLFVFASRRIYVLFIFWVVT